MMAQKMRETPTKGHKADKRKEKDIRKTIGRKSKWQAWLYSSPLYVFVLWRDCYHWWQLYYRLIAFPTLTGCRSVNRWSTQTRLYVSVYVYHFYRPWGRDEVRQFCSFQALPLFSPEEAIYGNPFSHLLGIVLPPFGALSPPTMMQSGSHSAHPTASTRQRCIAL